MRTGDKCKVNGSVFTVVAYSDNRRHVLTQMPLGGWVIGALSGTAIEKQRIYAIAIIMGYTRNLWWWPVEDVEPC